MTDHYASCREADEREERRERRIDPTNPFAPRPPFKPTNDDVAAFIIGDSVRKVGGDYQFEGEVVAVFRKKSGVIRYVVEDDRGVLHVYSTKNLTAAKKF